MLLERKISAHQAPVTRISVYNLKGYKDSMFSGQIDGISMASDLIPNPKVSKTTWSQPVAKTDAKRYNKRPISAHDVNHHNEPIFSGPNFGFVVMIDVIGP